jgi:hypothetical protein
MDSEVYTTDLGQRVVMRTIAQLDEAIPPSTLRGLIFGDQLVVSPDGLSSAHVITFRLGAEIVVHSTLGVVRPRFIRSHSREGTRILRVGYNSCLLWGQVDGHPPGLWKIKEDEAMFLAPLTRISRRSDGLVYGTAPDFPGQRLYLTAWDTLVPIHEQALVTAQGENLCIVESLAGETYAYELRREGGIRTFRRLSLNDAERPVGIVSWRGLLMLAVRRGSQSWLVELNPRSSGESPLRLQIDGDLKGVWSSPTGMTLALLVHPRGVPADVRQLQLNNRQIVYEGPLRLNDPPVWSPNERHVAMSIRMGDDVDHQDVPQIVGLASAYPIPAGIRAREMLVDDGGRLAAMIQHDGVYDQPLIRGHALTRVPLAWNLHVDQEGAIAWTTVHADRILTWSQQPTASISVGDLAR